MRTLVAAAFILFTFQGAVLAETNSETGSSERRVTMSGGSSTAERIKIESDETAAAEEEEIRARMSDEFAAKGAEEEEAKPAKRVPMSRSGGSASRTFVEMDHKNDAE